MATVYAIGGGNLYTQDTITLDRYIVNTIAHTPRVLFIPFASNDEEKLIDAFQRLYHDILLCEVDVLRITKDDFPKNPYEYFLTFDIIYFSGGSTERLVQFFKQYQLRELLQQLLQTELIFVGLSAGAILFFELGYGDKDVYLNRRKFRNFLFTEGLGLLPGVFCPHYQKRGIEQFNDEIKSHAKQAYCCEDGACFVFRSDSIGVLKSHPSNGAYLYHPHEQYFEYIPEGPLSLK